MSTFYVMYVNVLLKLVLTTNANNEEPRIRYKTIFLHHASVYCISKSSKNWFTCCTKVYLQMQGGESRGTFLTTYIFNTLLIQIHAYTHNTAFSRLLKLHFFNPIFSLESRPWFERTQLQRYIARPLKVWSF